MYIKDCKERETTPIITFINANDRKSLVTLKTRKVLNIRTDLKADTAEPFERKYFHKCGQFI